MTIQEHMVAVILGKYSASISLEELGELQQKNYYTEKEQDKLKIKLDSVSVMTPVLKRSSNQ
jgi:hypothetical protein